MKKDFIEIDDLTKDEILDVLTSKNSLEICRKPENSLWNLPEIGSHTNQKPIQNIWGSH